MENLQMRNFRIVSAPVIRKDAKALVTGKPVFTDDLALKDCLVVKVLRSPYAHALITEIDCAVAVKISGIECITTHKDVPRKRFTMAGQTYPEPSPYDRLILDERLRFMGDAMAVVAGETKTVVDYAMRLVRVKCQVLESVLDMHDSKDGGILVHPEDSWESHCNVDADNRRNLCASGKKTHGDLEEALAGCTHIIECVYHTKANQQAMMGTLRAYTYMDVYGCLNIMTSTQMPFHTRCILAYALDVPKSRTRVIKPRVGGGFGVRQTVVAKVYSAIVTMKTGRPAKIIYSRYESQIVSSPRHKMEVRVKLGCDDRGALQAMDVYTLSNTGACGEHGPTTVGLSGHKPIPLYRTPKAFRFAYDVVYTNRTSADAYQGYGVTQGIFAVELAVSELATQMGMDPVTIRELNIVKEEDIMPAHYGELANSCALDRCVAKVKEVIGWDEKYPRRAVSGTKVCGVGLATAMQGSAIPGTDMASVCVKVNDDGFHSLMIGAADMGTGCDTTLAQVATESLGCELEDIVVYGTDTDILPYDSGSYASSTAYLTSMAVVKTCEALKKRILRKAARYLECREDELEFDGKHVYKLSCEENGTRKEMTIKDIGNRVMYSNEDAPQVTESHSSPVSSPPFMVGAAGVEMDTETGDVKLIRFVAAVDCGTPLNINLARVQTEGDLAQGIGMALYEDVTYSETGRVHENSSMQCKVPSRQDVRNAQVEFEYSYESTGSYGAKSTGEIVTNTLSPATANVMYNAAGVRIRELPITAEKVFDGMNGLD